jgi:hypothetical protein
MIKRYLIKEIEDIWNQNNKISTWKKVESSVTKQLEDAGIVPKGLSAEILKVNISLEELEEREKVTNHDVASFVDILQNRIDENSEWVHYGLTSSDIVDTSNSLLIIESLDFLLIQIDKLIQTLKNLAIKEKDTKNKQLKTHTPHKHYSTPSLIPTTTTKNQHQQKQTFGVIYNTCDQRTTNHPHHKHTPHHTKQNNHHPRYLQKQTPHPVQIKAISPARN